MAYFFFYNRLKFLGWTIYHPPIENSTERVLGILKTKFYRYESVDESEKSEK